MAPRRQPIRIYLEAERVHKNGSVTPATWQIRGTCEFTNERIKTSTGCIVDPGNGIDQTAEAEEILADFVKQRRAAQRPSAKVRNASADEVYVADVVSYYIENGDFWKIDNITIGYQMPNEKIGLKNARIYVSGSNLFVFTNYKGIRAVGVARLSSSGLLDLAFVTGAGFNKTVFTVAPAGDGIGKLYVGGAFTNYNGTEVSNLVRLNPNGTRDFSFATGAGFNDAVFKVVPVGDGSGDVYVGGQFTQYQGILRGRFLRLTSSGALVH